MNRRQFMGAGLVGALGAAFARATPDVPAPRAAPPNDWVPEVPPKVEAAFRNHFGHMDMDEIFDLIDFGRGHVPNSLRARKLVLKGMGIRR